MNLLALLGGWKLKAIAAVAILAAVVGIYQAGVNAERRRGEAAELRVQIETLKTDKRLAEQAQISAADKAVALATELTQQEEALDALRKSIAAKPEGDRCPATGADLDLLYEPGRP